MTLPDAGLGPGPGQNICRLQSLALRQAADGGESWLMLESLLLPAELFAPGGTTVRSKSSSMQSVPFSRRLPKRLP